jgi:hypothetical protein
MYTEFTPMSILTVQFAKDYRAEQISIADQWRMAAQFRKPSRIRRISAALAHPGVRPTRTMATASASLR